MTIMEKNNTVTFRKISNENSDIFQNILHFREIMKESEEIPENERIFYFEHLLNDQDLNVQKFAQDELQLLKFKTLK